MIKKTIVSLLTLALIGCNSSDKAQTNENKTKFTSVCSQDMSAYGDPLSFSVEGNSANLKGIICSGSPAAFKEMLSQHKNITTLNFINIDGSINDDANLQLAYAVRNNRLNSSISSTGSIASGGTDLFIAGVKRTVEEGASIGVHSWGYEGDNGEIIEGANLPVDHKDHKNYIEYYKTMELAEPSNFYWFTLKAAGINGMHDMTAEEIQRFGLSTNFVNGVQTTLTNDADKAMIKQIKSFTAVSHWKGFNYPSEPQYLIRVDSKKSPIAGFIINPKSQLKGANKLGNNESEGLNIYRFDDEIFNAVQYIKDGGNDLYSFDFKIEGKKYYAQKYTSAVTATQHPYTNDLMFSPHEIFHIYQKKWQYKSEWTQNVDSYPTTEKIIKDELLLTAILKGFPKKVTQPQARELLKQYIAIRQNQMNNDNTALVKNMALYQELGEGSAQYVGILTAKAVFGDTYDDIVFDQTAKYGFEIKDKEALQWHFGFNVFYNSGASVIFLLNELGYDITQLEGKRSPFDAAKSLVGYEQNAYQRAVHSVGPEIEDIKEDAKKYAAIN